MTFKINRLQQTREHKNWFFTLNNHDRMFVYLIIFYMQRATLLVIKYESR